MRPRKACALFAWMPALLLAGCADSPMGFERDGDGTLEGPVYAAGLLPAVQVARATPRLVELSDGSSKTFMMVERLDEDGTAHGFASLTDPEDPSQRVDYLFRQGRLTCEAGVPGAELSGVEIADGEAGFFQVTIEPVLIASGAAAERSGDREQSEILSFSWGSTSSGQFAGQHFVTAVNHGFISESACAG